MKLSIVLRPNDLVVRLPQPEDSDVDTYAVSVIKPGQRYGDLTYDYLRSLGDGGWDINDGGANRLRYDVLDDIAAEHAAAPSAGPAVR